MPEEKPKRNRSKEYERLKAERLAAEMQEAEDAAANAEAEILSKLAILERRTKGKPTDADGDIDFAYRNMALATVCPLDAPSTAAWSWYVFARDEPNEFLKITQKREDAKAKQAGTITNQRMEDDRRQQFAVIERIQRQLTIDVRETVKELMEKFPDDVLHECVKHKDAWTSFFERFPL